MKNLSQSILNYFATFTETRFNFKRLINYKWTNNELTLDLSLFSEVEARLLSQIRSGKLESISIKRGEYSLKLPKELLIKELNKALKDNFDQAYLRSCIEEFSDNNESDFSWKEGARKFNLALRKELEVILIKQQEKIIKDKKEELGIEQIPQSTFGMNNFLQEHFNEWQSKANKYKEVDKYIEYIRQYFKKNIEDVTLYDLFFNLQKYSEFANLGSLYLFFHAITQKYSSGGLSFPLYFVEVEMRPAQTEVLITFPRNLFLINSPAINGFKFDQVLTTPRSCTITKANTYLGSMEVFLQSQYGYTTPFITEPSFKDIVHDIEEKPMIQSRIGLQTITNEDKKLLDYSEIMTNLDTNKKSRFTDMVNDYVEGKIPNYQEEVSRAYKEKYPPKSTQRYIANSPIPINDSQKRILLALANEKNRLVVVDGPPGTGKSHTIAALTYWANEQKKSVVITSHKKEALDVIDRMLSDKYKHLHPQAKPSIARMDRETGSENSLQNTLQSAVINAASDRTLDFNDSAIKEDMERTRTEIEEMIKERIDNGTQSVDDVRALVEYIALRKKLEENNSVKTALTKISKKSGLKGAVNVINEMIASEKHSSFKDVSLSEYKWFLSKQSQLSEFLEACEKINNVPDGSLDTKPQLTSIPDNYMKLLDDLFQHFKLDIPLGELTPAHGKNNIISSLVGKGAGKDKKAKMLKSMNSLKQSGIIQEIARAIGSNKDVITLNKLKEATDKVLFKLSFRDYETWIDEYKALPGNKNKGLIEIYNKVRQLGSSKDIFSEKDASAMEVVFDNFNELLDAVNITSDNIYSLGVKENKEVKDIFKFIEIHAKLSDKSFSVSNYSSMLDEYYSLEQKRVENINDTRFKGLNNSLNELQRIKVSYEGGKRFNREETDVLLSGVSCVIAEPSTISKYMPMEEEMIDVLIIDEASQVSIADSISLMLRAKQVVIFGDEYQYGAVSAVNVNAKYSTSYFSEIINAYQDDFNLQVSDKDRSKLVSEISKDIDADEQQSDEVIKSDEIAPGTILWLKTFNIRTSTLSFAKAMANYTSSLKEHFRSFPEIIGYSNEVFYKPAQLELIVNRIRTKPIDETLKFIRVKTKGEMAPNTNLDEIDAIVEDIELRLKSGFNGTIGIIASFREQQVRLEQTIQERLDMPRLKQNHKLAVWFVGDVQGEERDIVYYSLVEDKKIKNANLASIYPVIGGTADSTRALKMQRLNVGFSRAKDTMVFVHSQDIEKYSNTRLGDALKHYSRVLEESKKNDMFVASEDVFDSPKEKELYQLLLQTPFVNENKDSVRIIPQFPIGKYIRAEFAVRLPEYRVDFLLTFTQNGKTHSLILEYDGLEYHFKNPHDVPSSLLSSEYIDYDVQRQLELESYGYHFLRINYFTLIPEHKDETKVDVLNRLLIKQFS